LNGPFRAGKGDLDTFQNHGLKDKIPAGKKAIADKGYIGESEKVSFANSHDSDEIRNFKGRARARHEGFNGRIKNFKCLDERFRHGIPKFKICFEAVCVICVYQMDNGSPLYDV
jgi:hypothetical protein